MKMKPHDEKKIELLLSMCRAQNLHQLEKLVFLNNSNDIDSFSFKFTEKSIPT